MTDIAWNARIFSAFEIFSQSALGWATLFSLALIPLSLILLAVDQRVLGNEALWLKPLKFQISMAVMCGTIVLAIAASGLSESLWVRLPSLAVAITAFYELIFLNIQAGRGVRSHFNADTAFDRIGGAIMAGGAGVLVLGAALIGAAILVVVLAKGCGAFDEPVLLAFGLGLVLGGALSGWTGGVIGANGGPFVGTATGPYVPLFGWSLGGGDLRIAHFVGLHAMQALPITALILRTAIPASATSAMILIAAFGWTALTFFILRVAQGQGVLDAT